MASYDIGSHAHRHAAGGDIASRADWCPPPCPACGSLECLCRPRFFAGQLLTDEDLNRLDHYIVEKNKLHNRYVHGWGVVCGLEVVCSPCDGMVTVRTGYALSPCGEDIVVCREQTVDVCALIRQCRDVVRDDCEPGRARGDDACQEGEEPWVLAICYDEKPSRGITPLRAEPSCGCAKGCGCGGSGGSCCGKGSGGSCGGGAAACGCSDTKTSRPATKPRRLASPQCEPTLTCESYHFKVYKAPKPRRDDRTHPASGIVLRIQACLQELAKQLTPPPPQSDREGRHRWCCDLKEELRELIIEVGGYDCQLLAALARVVCPDTQQFPNNPSGFDQALMDAFLDMMPIAAELLRYCFCSALLPQCPPPVELDCVPLATVTVRRRDCLVLRVCNWGVRKLVMTFPLLWEWLSIFPIFQTLGQSIEQACCRPFPRPRPQVSGFGRASAPPASSFGRAAPAETAAGEKDMHAFGALLAQAFANRARVVDPTTVMLGGFEALDAKGEPFASPLEMDNAAMFLLLNQLLRPGIDATLPPAWTGARREGEPPAAPAGVAPPAAGPAPASADEVEELKKAVASLSKKVNSQEKTIRELKGRK